MKQIYYKLHKNILMLRCSLQNKRGKTIHCIENQYDVLIDFL